MAIKKRSCIALNLLKSLSNNNYFGDILQTDKKKQTKIIIYLDSIPSWDKEIVILPAAAVSGPGEGLLLNRAGEVSGLLLCSAVRTVDSAATAAALCDPWLDRDGFGAPILVLEDGLNAEDRAASADAL